MHCLEEVNVNESGLMRKGYNAKELIDHTIIVKSVTPVSKDDDNYISCEIEGEGLEPGRNLVTGAQNIMVRLLAAKEQNMLPIHVTIVKLGGNALDIV